MPARPDKPPYRVPPMAEIAAIPWNGYTVASAFSGCGGSCLGWRMAGFRVGWASEFVPAAQESYRANAAPGSVLDGRDIRDVRAAEVLAALGMGAGDLDVWEDSPPCDSFSTSGRREAKWGQEKDTSGIRQRTDDLFWEYARLLRGLQPRAFVAENVSGLVKGTAKGYFLRILAELRGCGYTVRARLLDASWLGVPQKRQRIIFAGVRADLGIEPAFPAPLPYRYSVRDALPWITAQDAASARPGEIPPGVAIGPLMTMDAHGWFDGRSVDLSTEPAPTILAGGFGADYRLHASSDPTALAPSHERDWHARAADRRSFLSRPGLDEPVATIAASGATTASVTHPTEPRRFTIPELKRLGAFPDDFILTGSYAQQWERVGNSVPPVMMYHVAGAVRDRVLRPLDGR